MAYNLDLRLFTLPFKVSETVDEEVIVLDKTSKDKGRLIMAVGFHLLRVC
jgi:hypothetical protein